MEAPNLRSLLFLFTPFPPNYNGSCPHKPKSLALMFLTPFFTHLQTMKSCPSLRSKDTYIGLTCPDRLDPRKRPIQAVALE